MFWENFGSIRIFAVGRENFSNEETLRFSLSLSRFVHKIFLQSIYLNGFRGNSKARANVDERERERERSIHKKGRRLSYDQSPRSETFSTKYFSKHSFLKYIYPTSIHSDQVIFTGKIIILRESKNNNNME